MSTAQLGTTKQARSVTLRSAAKRARLEALAALHELFEERAPRVHLRDVRLVVRRRRSNNNTRLAGANLRVRVPEAAQVRPPLVLGHHDASTCLAHALQDGHDVFEVADVKDGQLQADVACSGACRSRHTSRRLAAQVRARARLPVGSPHRSGRHSPQVCPCTSGTRPSCQWCPVRWAAATMLSQSEQRARRGSAPPAAPHQARVQDAVPQRRALRHLVQVALEDMELGDALDLLVAHEPEPDALSARHVDATDASARSFAARNARAQRQRTHILRGAVADDSGSRVRRISSLPPPARSMAARREASRVHAAARSTTAAAQGRRRAVVHAAHHVCMPGRRETPRPPFSRRPLSARRSPCG